MSSNPEIPQEEMARLMRIIAGSAACGETEAQLRARAARRLGLSESRGKTFWYGETQNIKSFEMDRARELAFVQPIEEAIYAIEKAEQFMQGLRQRIMAQGRGRCGGLGGKGRACGVVNTQARPRGGKAHNHSGAAVLDSGLTSLCSPSQSAS